MSVGRNKGQINAWTITYFKVGKAIVRHVLLVRSPRDTLGLEKINHGRGVLMCRQMTLGRPAGWFERESRSANLGNRVKFIIPQSVEGSGDGSNIIGLRRVRRSVISVERDTWNPGASINNWVSLGFFPLKLLCTYLSWRWPGRKATKRLSRSQCSQAKSERNGRKKLQERRVR